MLLARRALAPVAARSFSTTVRAATAEADAPADSVKQTIFSILGGSDIPMTSAEMWEEAQNKGVRSKRHLKLMLQDLRKRGWVLAKPGAIASAKRDKAFRYELSPKTLSSQRYTGPKPAEA